MEQQETTTAVKVFKKNNLQVIVNDEQFMFMKKIAPSTCVVVTPWQRMSDGSCSSNFQTVENRLFRVQNFYNLLGNNICRYMVADGLITVDCLNKMEPETFPKDVDSGWFHYLVRNVEKDDVKVVDIDERLILESVEKPLQDEFRQPEKVEFKTKSLKAFPFFMSQGFGIAKVEKDSAILWVTVQETEKQYCGITNKGDLNSLLHNITPVFPSVFRISIDDKKSFVFLKIDGIKPFLNKLNSKKALLRLEYSFADTKRLLISAIGISN